MTKSADELNRLRESGQIYGTEAGDLNRDIASFHTAEIIKDKKLIGGKALQLGLGDGYIAEKVCPYYEKLVVLEGSDKVIQQFYNPKSGYAAIHTFFEDYQEKGTYDVLLGNHILEHVEDPVAVLKQARKSLKPGAKAMFTVPNADSLHRRIGVAMGMLEKRNSLHGQDLLLGHRRVYTLSELQKDVSEAGYKITESFGYILKLVSNAQMKGWSKELLAAIYQTSRTVPPEICSNIGVICEVF